MAFIKKLWKDRISQFPNRRTINDGYVTKQVTVGRDEGTITEPGDSFDASNMNDLEQRIEDAYGDVVSLVASEVAAQYDQENVIFDPVATEGHGTGFVVSSDYIANLKAGDLKDVNITSPTQGEALVFDADGNIVNGTVSTVGNLDDLSDVDTTGKQEGDSLRYIGNEWKSKPTTYKIDKADFDLISDFTPYANSKIVVPDAPNLNPTASDIEYTSGVSVADELTSLASDKADKSAINNLYVVGTTDYTVTSSMTVPANGYKEIVEMANAIPSGAIFLDASIPNNNGGYLFFQIGYYGKYYIIARNFTGSAVTINANQIISVRYMYKPNLA